MPIPQESVNVQSLEGEGLSAIKRDIGALCRDARGPHNNAINRDAADQHPASSITFTPAGTIAATTVQGAIEESSGDLTTHEALTTTAHGGLYAAALSYSWGFQ